MERLEIAVIWVHLILNVCVIIFVIFRKNGVKRGNLIERRANVPHSDRWIQFNRIAAIERFCKRLNFFETNTKMDAIPAVNHHEGGLPTPGMVHHFYDFDLIGFKELFHQNRIIQRKKTSIKLWNSGNLGSNLGSYKCFSKICFR